MIPKRFKIGERDVIVGWNNKDGMMFKGVAAWCDRRNYTICLNRDLSEDTNKKLFLHEATHLLLHEMGEKELSKDERFVKNLSERFYQIISSMQTSAIHKDKREK